MPDTRRNHGRLKPDRQRAPALLAEQPNGVPEAVMTTAHSFSDGQLDELVQTGLAVRENAAGAREPPRSAQGRMAGDHGRRTGDAGGAPRGGAPLVSRHFSFAELELSQGLTNVATS